MSTNLRHRNEAAGLRNDGDTKPALIKIIIMLAVEVECATLQIEIC